MSDADQGLCPVMPKTGCYKQWYNTNQHDSLFDLPGPAATFLWEREKETMGALMLAGEESECVIIKKIKSSNLIST